MVACGGSGGLGDSAAGGVAGDGPAVPVWRREPVGAVHLG
jgi:hypothetical protein